jgi:hypothetical protein
MDVHMSDEYEGTLSSLTRYGTLNTPSLKTGHERKGKAKIRHTPRVSNVGHGAGTTGSDVKVYMRGDEENAVSVPASAYARKRRIVRNSPTSDEARAWMQAQADHRMALQARVAGNEQAL